MMCFLALLGSALMGAGGHWPPGLMPHWSMTNGSYHCICKAEIWICPWHHGDVMTPFSNEIWQAAPQYLGLGLGTRNKWDRFFLLLLRNKCSCVPCSAHRESGMKLFWEVTQLEFYLHMSLCKSTYGNAFSSVPVPHILHTQIVEFDGMCT